MHVSKMIVKPARGMSPRTPVSIQALLEWAFQKERISLDFSDRNSADEFRPNFGLEYVLMQEKLLGCRPDGGGRSDPHPDADTVASALIALPDVYGGRRMAIQIAELARDGLSPYWKPQAQMRCRPVEWRQSKHGTYAKTAALGELRYEHRGRFRVFDVRCCPVKFIDTAADLARLRRGWLNWWDALRELRITFQAYGGLTAYQVTDQMPPRTPWREIS